MRIISVGRSPETDISINDQSVSWFHARIIIERDSYTIEDNNSSNGTFLNGRKITKSGFNFSDNIILGNFKLDFRGYSGVFDMTSSNKGELHHNQLNFSGRKEIRIGRAPDNDIIINDQHISNYHAVLTIENGNMSLQDMGSRNGTFVNRQQISSAQITTADFISLGSYKFSLERFANYLIERKPDISLSNVSVTLKEGINKIGRAQDNDVILKHPMISAHHAVIKRRGKIIYIEDLSSANGVFINGKRIRSGNINPGDKVAFGTFSINITSDIVLKTYKGDIKLDLKDVSFEVNNNNITKKILSNISLTVFPTEFVGLIGPSGSGKTTLMNVINGYVNPSKGQVLINSNNLHTNYDLFRGNIGFVPQDDIIHRELTVYQSLFYSAKLRLPIDTTEEEIKSRINDILLKLDLLKSKDVIIGSPEKTGISGGQRKRVNLAQELITQPSLLLLDEPTSGLDPRTDHDIMVLLRKLADDGRIIILTTHHISERNFKLFDNLILLASGGKLAYFGPAYPDSVEYYKVKEPQDIFTKLEERGSGESNNAMYKKSKYHTEYVEKRRTNTKDLLISGKASIPKQKRRFGFKQFISLLQRYYTIKKTDTINLLILFLQAPLIGLLIGLTLGKEENNPNLPPSFINPVFVMIVCSIFFGVLNTSREIVAERAIYYRERMVMLKIPSYLFSKYFLLTFISIFQSVTLVIVTYYLCGLKGDIMFIILNITLLSLSSMALGLLLSAIVKTPEAAISMAIFAIIPQIIFGGAILLIGKMEGIMKYASYLLLSRWAFDSIMRNEGTKQNAIQKLENLKFINQENNTLLCLLMIAFWGAFYLLAVSILLKKRDNV